MSNDRRPAFLSLKDLTPDRAAARLLPLNVARRCRALPIAQDSGCITVAMADPTDCVAREGVTAALLERAAGQADCSPQVYLVQGDPTLIDAWLANLALVDDEPKTVQPATQPLEVWLREPLHGDKAAIINYAAQMAVLLAAPLGHLDPLTADRDWPDFIAHAGHRLLISPCLDYNLSSALQAGDDRRSSASGREDPAPTLYACRPRWPLSRLLLIVRGDTVDDAALAWATRLARASDAATTALMIAPHTPASHALPTHDDISSLLSANNTTGHKMQHAAQRLAALQLDAVLHLRQGSPETVIREELASTPYDLAIAGVAVRSAGAQWRLRPLLHKLLPEMNCPLLLTAGRGE